MWRQEAKYFAIGGVLRRRVRIFVVLLCRRGIVDIARQNHATAIISDEAHRVVFLAALTAEMNRIEPLFWIARQELLPLDGHHSPAWRLERREGVART